MLDSALDHAALTQLSALIDLIYEGAIDLRVWPTVPQAISRWMSAPQCTLFTPAHTLADGGFMMAHNLSPLSIEMWATKYQQIDLWALRARDRNLGITGSVFRDQDLATEDEFLATEMYREFFAPMDVGRLASGVVFGIESTTQIPVVCSCNRPLRDPFFEEDLFKLSLLLPHLSRALGVMFRLREAEFKLASTLSALDMLNQSVILLGRDGDVFHANRMARELLDTADGLTLVTTTGTNARQHLRTSRASQQRQLDAAINAALRPDAISAQHFAVALSVNRPSGLPAYNMHFSSLPPGNEFGQGASAPRAIAFIDSGAAKQSANLQVLRQRYGLSDAELRVTELAAEGHSVEGLAAALGISSNTVKTHLKRIYDKTGARNRSQLLKLVLGSHLAA